MLSGQALGQNINPGPGAVDVLIWEPTGLLVTSLTLSGTWRAVTRLWKLGYRNNYARCRQIALDPIVRGRQHGYLCNLGIWPHSVLCSIVARSLTACGMIDCGIRAIGASDFGHLRWQNKRLSYERARAWIERARISTFIILIQRELLILSRYERSSLFGRYSARQ